MNKQIIIYTDGGCKVGNGGWAFVLLNYKNREWRVSGCEKNTTNNRMELTALIQALTFISKLSFSSIVVYTDSQYVIKGCTEWYKRWIKTNFKKVKNDDLWRILLKKVLSLPITFHLVKGHAKHKYNEVADKLCSEAIREIT